jgi:uncharacterized membrane protein
MTAILTNLRNTVIAGVIAVIVMVVIVGLILGFPMFETRTWWAFLFRWLHVVSGIMWVGLLYYLNFVQIPTMPKIPDEMKPALGKFIVPSLLFWFRWAANATIVTGLLLAWLSPTTGGLGNALALGITNGGASTPIGIGMWIGIVLWFNVWFVIWPHQKKALGMVEAEPDAKARSARIAFLVSRLNTVLSLPMLYCMVAAQNRGFG